MVQTIILLSGEAEAPHLSEALTSHNPALSVEAVTSADMLAAAVGNALARGDAFRLIAFCTDIIIPASLLARLPAPAYNFHAAPPRYPGSCAANFAIYEGADSFGVTVHEIAPAVDTGVIVATRTFPVSPGMTASDLASQAYQCLSELFFDLARRLATDMSGLPPSGETWRGTARTRAEAEKLAVLEDGLGEAEIDLRRRAFGNLAR